MDYLFFNVQLDYTIDENFIIKNFDEKYFLPRVIQRALSLIHI